MFARFSEEKLVIGDLPVPYLEMLRAIPTWNESSGEAAEARLFPEPSVDDKSLQDDWKAHVQPGLFEKFQDARNTVLADLGSVRQVKDLFAIEIPIGHVMAWVNAVNQARLAIAATHDFQEEDMGGELPIPPKTARDLALLEMEFFGHVQEFLVAFLMQSSGEDADPEGDQTE
jgi:hypothetical protein